MLKDFDPGFYRAGATVLGLVSVSTVLLWLTYKKPGMSLLDALYFSTETVATVGYGDFNFIDQSPVAADVGDLPDGRRRHHHRDADGVPVRHADQPPAERLDRPPPGARDVRARRGDRPRRRSASGWPRALVEAGKQVVVIERDPENRFLSEAQELGVPVIFGDATLRPTLDAARVAESSAVAVMTSNDMVNIETAIAVRDLFGAHWWRRAGGAGGHPGLRPGAGPDHRHGGSGSRTSSPPRN